MIAPGQRIESYVVVRELGGGGMASVYLVRDVNLDVQHALKVLDPRLRGRPEVLERFLNEGKVEAILRHRNIVEVHGAVVTDEVAGLVMEYVEGPSLERYIAESTALPSAESVRALFLPVLDAVGYAHSRQVIHRDLKPANILLMPEGTGWVPKVTDFGIAKLSDALAGKKRSTAADARMGTLGYMSPEQHRSAKYVTVRADIFSLGATLYELATCKPAFEGSTDYEIMDAVVKGVYVPPGARHPGINPAIAAAIERALRTDPDQRYATCEEFAAALRTELVPEAPGPQRRATVPSRPELLLSLRCRRCGAETKVGGVPGMEGQAWKCPKCGASQRTDFPDAPPQPDGAVHSQGPAGRGDFATWLRRFVGEAPVPRRQATVPERPELVLPLRCRGCGTETKVGGVPGVEGQAWKCPKCGATQRTDFPDAPP